MKEFEHLVSVWQGQPAAGKLSVDEALKQVKKGIRGITSKLYWGIVSIIALIVFAFIITFFFAFKSPATTIGILIILVTMLMYLSFMVRHYHILNKHDLTLNPAGYLNTLKVPKKQDESNWLVLLYLFVAHQYRAGLIFYGGFGNSAFLF